MVAFALLSECLSPKRFAGLFSAAPAVALAGLSIVVLDKGAHEAHENSVGDSAEAREDARGAVIGGCALRLFAAVAALALGHLNPAVALLLASVAWLVGVLLGYVIAWFK